METGHGSKYFVQWLTRFLWE